MNLLRSLVAIVSVSLISLGGVSPVRAELVGTADVQSAAQASNDRAKVAAFLGRQDVREQLSALGVAPEEAAARVAALSDDEVAALASGLDRQPAGQGFVGAVVAVVVVTAGVLFFTDLLGYTNVYPFLDPLPRAPAAEPDPGY